MKKALLFIIAVSMIFVGLEGCSQQSKAANAQQAIDQSKSMKTADEQAKYLVGQANAFVNNKNFDQAIQTAKYVLANLNANSQEAKGILEKAAEDMKKMAQQKAEEMKKSLGNLGK